MQKIVNVAEDNFCPNCDAKLEFNKTSGIMLYRIGSYFGRFGEYKMQINGTPYGKIGNRKTLFIPLPFGFYKLHFSAFCTRCPKDLTVFVFSSNPIIYVKFYTRPGFWINDVIPFVSNKNEMSPLE